MFCAPSSAPPETSPAIGDRSRIARSSRPFRLPADTADPLVCPALTGGSREPSLPGRRTPTSSSTRSSGSTTSTISGTISFEVRGVPHSCKRREPAQARLCRDRAARHIGDPGVTDLATGSVHPRTPADPIRPSPSLSDAGPRRGLVGHRRRARRSRPATAILELDTDDRT